MVERGRVLMFQNHTDRRLALVAQPPIKLRMNSPGLFNCYCVGNGGLIIGGC